MLKYHTREEYPTPASHGVPFHPRYGLSGHVADVVAAYTSDSHGLNKLLRDRMSLDSTHFMAHNTLHDLMQEIPAHPTGIHVTRAVNLGDRRDFNRLSKAFEAGVGKVIQLRGYQSTRRGVNRASSSQFLGDEPDNPHRMFYRIRAKHGLDVSRVSNHDWEKEIVLPHNSSFKVLGYHAPTKTVHLEQVV